MADIHVTVIQIRNGTRLTRWRKQKYILNDRVVSEAQRDLEAGIITVPRYLRKFATLWMQGSGLG